MEKKNNSRCSGKCAGKCIDKCAKKSVGRRVDARPGKCPTESGGKCMQWCVNDGDAFLGLCQAIEESLKKIAEEFGASLNVMDMESCPDRDASGVLIVLGGKPKHPVSHYDKMFKMLEKFKKEDAKNARRAKPARDLRTAKKARADKCSRGCRPSAKK